MSPGFPSIVANEPARRYPLLFIPPGLTLPLTQEKAGRHCPVRIVLSPAPLPFLPARRPPADFRWLAAAAHAVLPPRPAWPVLSDWPPYWAWCFPRRPRPAPSQSFG